ncbi:MAG: peptidase M16 [Candidatus Aminicenantes bacterium]|nr:peptidase M16 [Candidatus Aminicenantes bacterium]
MLKTKPILFILFSLFFFFMLSDPALSQEREETSSHFKLENGLDVFLYKKTTLPLVHFVFGFDVGSKDELIHASGMVHILEHCILFRGTKFIDDTDFPLEIRKHGAYYNAHTGRDLSVFEMTLPSEHCEFALGSLKQILFDFHLKQKNLEDEKQVILEELNQIHDDPYKTAVSVLYQNLFQNHPYHSPVYGSKAVIQEMTAEDIMSFYSRYFVPSNSALAVVGDFSLSDMEETIQSVLGSLPSTEFQNPDFQDIKPLKETIRKTIQMDVDMGYLAIGLNAPGYNSKDQYAADLLTEIFGRGFNPLINQPLLRRRIQAHSLRMAYFCDQYGGAITLFIGMDPKQIPAAESEIIKYLKTSRTLNYSKSDYSSDTRFHAFDILKSAQNRIKYKIEESGEQGLLIGLSLVRHLLMSELQDRGDYLEKINSLNSSDIRQAAGDYFSQKGKVIVRILPQEKE